MLINKSLIIHLFIYLTKYVWEILRNIKIYRLVKFLIVITDKFNVLVGEILQLLLFSSNK